MREMRKPDREDKEVRLLHAEHLQFLHKEPEKEENRAQDSLQDVLDQHSEENAVQERELAGPSAAKPLLVLRYRDLYEPSVDVVLVHLFLGLVFD